MAHCITYVSELIEPGAERRKSLKKERVREKDTRYCSSTRWVRAKDWQFWNSRRD